MVLVLNGTCSLPLEATDVEEAAVVALLGIPIPVTAGVEPGPFQESWARISTPEKEVRLFVIQGHPRNRPPQFTETDIEDLIDGQHSY